MPLIEILQAIAEERKCTEDSQARNAQVESQVKACREELKAVQPLRVELEVVRLNIMQYVRGERRRGG